MRYRALIASLIAGVVPIATHAQVPGPPRPGPGLGQPALVSPDILPDHRVIFRIRAPQASAVTLAGDVGEGLPASAPPRAATTGATGFIPPPPAVVLEKGPNGIWTGTTAAPVRPGAYRYAFSVDGVRAVDQSNMRTSPSQGQVQSLLVVPGDFSEERPVPHGALSEIAYEPASYGPGVERRLYVYTPPGYEKSTASYPVLYLIHGGGDTAESWATVGRANFIMDNLLAEKKAVPFIIVMISGWTPRGPQSETIDAAKDPLNAELINDIIPMIEHRYRVKGGKANRALSGLSMGGFQTLTLGIKNLDAFAYVMPMSTGWFTDADRAAFVAANGPAIHRADKELALFRWGWGDTDIAKPNGLASMDALRVAGMRGIETIEVPGGHQWTTWRQLLADYAPRLFR